LSSSGLRILFNFRNSQGVTLNQIAGLLSQNSIPKVTYDDITLTVKSIRTTGASPAPVLPGKQEVVRNKAGFTHAMPFPCRSPAALKAN
jgi:hypothetical protein